MEGTLLDQLTARAAQRKQDRLQVKQFAVGDMMLEFQSLPAQKRVEVYGQLTEISSGADSVALSCAIIYDCCPALQDTALHQAIGITDPSDVVPALMDIFEIDQLALKLMQWMGIVSDTRDQKGQAIKN